jgi:hypothetical protein
VCTEERVLPDAGINRNIRHLRHRVRHNSHGCIEHYWRTVLSTSIAVQDIELLLWTYAYIIYDNISNHVISVAWFSYLTACAVLALCRCMQMYSAQMMNRL